MPEEVKKVQMLLAIGLTPEGKLIVQGNLEEKVKCLTYLAEAIKVVANFERNESKIIKPNVRFQKPHGGIMKFVRGKRN